MTHYTFDSNSSQTKLKSLISAFEKFKKDEPETSEALKLASETWHLTDWVFKEFLDIHLFSDLGKFRNDLFQHCPTLKIMHDIANASKHSEVSRPKANIKSTNRHQGDFAISDFSSDDFDVTRLEIHLDNGTVLNFEKELKKTLDFWKSYFSHKLSISI